MWDFSIGRSIDLMVKTMPFILFRMAVYFGIAAAYVIVTGTGAGIGWGVGAFGDMDFQASTTFWGGIIGFGATAGAIYLLREYILYIVKAGHIAVMVEYLDGKPLPEGRGQIAHASAVVKERFAEANVLFAVDLLVKGVLGAITGMVQGVASLLPIPGLQQIMSVIRAFLRLAVGLIDEVILGYAIRTRSDNPWQSAQTALVLYGQNYQPMLRNAAWLTAITYGLSFIVFLVMLAPAAAVVYLIPGGWSAGGFIFAILFAWAFKAALIEPFAIACMLQAYFKTIEGQSPDPAWEARLSELSGKFRELKTKGMDWAGGARAEAPAIHQAVRA
jgi:hypothetical protein